MTATETKADVLEWRLSGLRALFEASEADKKSELIKSETFGDGRWVAFFYAQSGYDQFCSLYLTALPREDELKGTDETKDSWSREGTYNFTFTIQTPDKSKVLATKEAGNHTFSSITLNWGWAQFSKRDTVFYGNQLVKDADQFIIKVSVTANQS